MQGRESRALLGVLFAASLAFLAACNQGQDSDSTEVLVEGRWSGTYAAPGVSYSLPAVAFIRKDGIAFFFDSHGIMYRLPRFDGGFDVQGEVRAFAPIGYTFTTGHGSASYRLQATVLDSGITGDLQNDEGSGPLNLHPLETFDDAPGLVSGQWTGYYITPTPYAVTLQVDAAGHISGNDVFGCSLTGRLDQLKSGEDLFSMVMTSSGPLPVCGKTFKGLAYESIYDTYGYFKGASGTYYYLGGFSEDSAFVAEVKVE